MGLTKNDFTRAFKDALGQVHRFLYDIRCSLSSLQGSSTRGEDCQNPQYVSICSTFEICLPYTIELKEETICLDDIVSNPPAGITPSKIVGFEFTLKPIGGETFDGFTSTTSDATSTGPIGDRNFDSLEKWTITPDRLPDGTFNALPNQCITVEAGSIGVLNINFID